MKAKKIILTAAAALICLALTSCGVKLEGNSYTSTQNDQTITFSFLPKNQMEMSLNTIYADEETGEPIYEEYVFFGTYDSDAKSFSTHFYDLEYRLNGDDLTQTIKNYLPEEVLESMVSGMDGEFGYTKSKTGLNISFEGVEIEFEKVAK